MVKENPDIINNPEKRKSIAEEHGLSEKTLRNRIGDLKKYGVLSNPEEENIAHPESDFDDIDLFRVGQIIWSSRKEIIRNVIVVSFLSVILALILPKTYRSTAMIMPPSSDINSSFLANNPNLMSLQNILPSINTNANTLIAILKSRTIMQSAIEQYNLVEFYNVDNTEKAQEALVNNTNFEIEEEGTISLTTYVKTGWFHSQKDEDYCKKLSKDITNYFLIKLDEVNKKLKSEKATLQRKFIENRYYQNISDLAIAEEKLKYFQKQHNTIDLPEQTSALIQVSTELITKISISEIKISISKEKLKILEETLPKGHPEILILETEIKLLETEFAGLNKQLGELDHGKNEISMIPGFSEVPDLGLELGRLLRDVRVQSTLFTFITQQYEEAKIQEAKDSPTVQVLDYASLPILKYKPTRSRVVIIGFVLSFIFSMYYVYFRKRWQLFNYSINK